MNDYQKDALLTVAQAANRTGITASMLAKYRMRGTGPAYVRLSNIVRYRVADLDAWIAENGTPAPRAKNPDKPHRDLICFTALLTDAYLRSLVADTDLQITDAAVSGLHMRYSHSTGRKSFFLHYVVRGTWKERNAKLGEYEPPINITEIRRRAMKMKEQVMEGRDPYAEAIDRGRALVEVANKRKTVAELTPIFLEKYCRVQNRPKTYETNETLIRLHVNPDIGKMGIEELNLKKLQLYYDQLCERKTVQTADHIFRFLSVFLNWCERYEYRKLNTNPIHLIRKQKAPKFKYRILTADEYKRLFATFDEMLNEKQFAPMGVLALKVLALTGCRCGEITELEHDELDLERGYLHLKKRKTDSFDVPLGDAAIDVLRQVLKICKSKKWVFHSPANPRKPIQELRRPWTAALTRAGIDHMRVHDLRHSFASMAAAIGEDIRRVKDVLGHTKITTTEIYSHTQTTQVRQTATNTAAAILGV